MSSTSSILVDLVEQDNNNAFPASCPQRFIDAEVRAEILKMTKNFAYISEYYKEVLRQMIATFGQMDYLDGSNNVKRVKCVHGLQERAVAERIKEDNIILPIVSVYQTVTQSSIDRVSFSPKLIHNKTWNVDKQRAERVISLSPKGVDINFLVTVWTKFKLDQDYIVQQVFSRFNPSLRIPTKFNTSTQAFLDEEEDLSEISVGDSSDRVLRKQFSVRVEGYIPSPKFRWTSTGKIEKLGVDVQIHKN